MALKSQLFRNDPKLEAAAVSDSAHIVPSSSGEHVRKLQAALVLLDGAPIAPDSHYGPATANAVLKYKQKRSINRSYQTKADDIVGKMTVASLDDELFALECAPPSLEVILPIQRYQHARGSLGGQDIRLALAPGAPPKPMGFWELPGTLTMSARRMSLRVGQMGIVRIRNGMGRELFCSHPSIAKLAPMDLPHNAHMLDRVKLTKSTEDIRVFANSGGAATVGFVNPKKLNFDPFLSVVVAHEVGVFFHFVDGQPGVKTKRRDDDTGNIIQTMNEIYARGGGQFVFFKAGSNTALRLPGVGGPMAAVRIQKSGGGPDWNAITANRRADAFFNVFFVGEIVDLTNLGSPTRNDVLAITSRPPDDTPPLRCCVCRDPVPSDPVGIDVGKTLAHEAGHALGEDDDRSDATSLMFFKQSGQTDTQISAAMTERMRASFQTR
jgi:hypothetical protein